MGSDTELSSTDDEQPQTLSKAERGRQTRRANQLKEQAANEALQAEIAAGDGRRTKKVANRAWKDLKRGPSPSLPEATQKSKKSKKTVAASGDDSIAEDHPGKQRTRAGEQPSSKAPKKNSAKPRKAEKLTSAKAPTGTRKYLPAVIPDSEDESDDDVPVVVKPRPKSKAKPTVTSSESTRDHTSPVPHVRQSSASVSGGEGDPALSEKESDAGKVSGDDDGLKGDSDEVQRRLLAERPLVIRSAVTPEVDVHDNLDVELVDLPPRHRHRRQSSSSSRGRSEFEVPDDSDIDGDAANGSGRDDDDSAMEDAPPARRFSQDWDDSEMEDVKPVRQSSGTKKSAQQLKYESEQPQIRPRPGAVRYPQPTDDDDMSKDPGYKEIEWHQTCRLRFPRKGGRLALLDQTDVVQAVVREAIDVGLHDLAFKHAYDLNATAGRAKIARALLRRAAKRLGERSGRFGERAKADLEFCKHLAPTLRNNIRNSSLQKVAAYYELNAPGLKPHEVRSKVKALEKDQKFIYPYNADHPFPTAPAPAGDANTTAEDAKKHFKRNSPFMAPAIADVIHEVWFKGEKSFGFKKTSVSKMISQYPALPKEPELPAPMICIAAANILAAILTYRTGTYVEAPEFSQSRLESTYVTLMNIVQGQRAGSDLNARAFHKVMHQIYLKASNIPAVAAASGSAANVMELDLSE
ncbi:hypothetical protein C8R43DRAFT_1132568 [Mycena crocata]|nr:hypothetical protein C8R43DRAFT_1132568 [Mycena crocata]